MNNFNVAEVFCEVLSGFAIMFFIIPLFDVLGISNIFETFAFMWTNLTAAKLVAMLVLAYILGIIMDSIGLSIGEWFLDDIICKGYPTLKDRKIFWNTVPSHVLAYRDMQWAYFSTYRNLAILTLFSGALWCWCLGAHYGIIGFIVVLVSMVILEIAFWKSMKVLLRTYYDLTFFSNSRRI